MTTSPAHSSATRNVGSYPWFRFCQSLLFWQAVWFLYFQGRLSASEAVLLYVVQDLATTVLEVPLGYLSDRLGRRLTLMASGLSTCAGALLIAAGDGFMAMAAGQVCLGAGLAFASGTDSALLYESLAAVAREKEVEAQEIRAWRFGFVGLALSAVSGGAAALISPALPFLATAVAGAASVLIAARFTDIEHRGHTRMAGAEWARMRSLAAALRHPALNWLFALSVLMYVIGHVPFVFGQPFIAEALARVGYQAEAPLVSGAVSSAMMLASVLASLFAASLRRRLGLVRILLVAFGLQIGLCVALSLSNSAFVILVLLMRMVPDALSWPFILARIQPVLGNDSRATYLSLQSLCGRLVLAASLVVVSYFTAGDGILPYAELQLVLAVYVAAGLTGFAVLWVTARRALEEG